MNDNLNTAEQPSAPAEKAPRVRRPRLVVLKERLAAAETKVAELQTSIDEFSAEIKSIEALAAVTVGSKVFVTVGRGDKAKLFEGVVLGVKEDDEDGTKQYKVQYGSGFDAEVAVVSASSISLPPGEQPADSGIIGLDSLGETLAG